MSSYKEYAGTMLTPNEISIFKELYQKLAKLRREMQIVQRDVDHFIEYYDNSNVELNYMIAKYNEEFSDPERKQLLSNRIGFQAMLKHFQHNKRIDDIIEYMFTLSPTQDFVEILHKITAKDYVMPE